MFPDADLLDPGDCPLLPCCSLSSRASIGHDPASSLRVPSELLLRMDSSQGVWCCESFTSGVGAHVGSAWSGLVHMRSPESNRVGVGQPADLPAAATVSRGPVPRVIATLGFGNVGARGAPVEPSLSTDGSVSAADFSKPDWGSMGGLRGDLPLPVLREQQIQRVDPERLHRAVELDREQAKLPVRLWDGVERHRVSPLPARDPCRVAQVQGMVDVLHAGPEPLDASPAPSTARVRRFVGGLRASPAPWVNVPDADPGSRFRPSCEASCCFSRRERQLKFTSSG